MSKQKIHIKGMHCRSCEILIEDELSKVKGVKKVYVNHKTGVADVDCECELDPNEVASAVQNAGYVVGEDGKLPLISKNRKDYIDLGIAFFITVALYFVAKTLGIFDLGKSITGGNYSSLPVVFIVGLTAGVSTCMALVGGLVLGAASRFSAKNPRATGMEKFTPHMYFNLGRIASYFVLGGALGFLGSIFQLSTSVLGMLTVIVGLVMLLLGGQLIDVFPFLKRVSFTLPKGISRAFGMKDQAELEYSNKNSAIMGASTFFLPCGFTQAMQLFAMSSGSPLTGALTMGVFALGTAPGLLGIGGLTSVVKGNGAKLFFKTAGVVVILLSLFNITNGLNLLGVTPEVLGVFTTKAAAGNTVSDPNVKMVNGVQEVRMNQESGGYRPNKFTIRKGIPVKWIITSKDIYTCAASIASQQLNIRKGLQLGENVFEFTPKETGTIRFSCSMGMFTGSFTVVDDKGAGVPQQATLANAQTQDTGATGGSCSAGGCGCGGAAKKAAAIQNSNEPATKPITQGNVQVIKASYTSLEDISPNSFTVKANQPVRLEILSKDNGEGCMGSIAVPKLSQKVEMLTKGETTIFEFTPTSTGTYPITCAMGVPRGQIQVI